MKGQPYRAAYKPLHERVRGVVYVVKNHVGMFKIGHTNNLKKRMSDHQRQYHGQPLEIVVTREVQDRYSAETKLHRMFAGQRVHREWFELTDRDLDAIRTIELEGKN